MEVNIYPFWSRKTWEILYKKGHYLQKLGGLISGFTRRKLWLFTATKADYIYIHREATPIGPPFIEWVLAKVLRKKIIYDFDDAIWLPNQSVANRGLVKNLKYHDKVAEICKWAYKVSVGNEFLAEYARQFNDDVVVITTTVDTENLHNPNLYKEGKTLRQSQSDIRQDRDYNTIPVIGWTGTHSTFHQLEIIWPILDEIFRKTPFKFHIISDYFPEMLPNYVREIYWNKEGEIEDLLKFDIGIMPLKDTEWEKGKCGFKLIQYMALEIPSVASDVGVSNEIINSPDCGMLIPYNDQEEWKQGLRKLLNDPALRKDMGIKGRQRIVKEYSVEANKEKVLGLFK
jgi:glycosyltransferase involved in cell wall biosynthesis